MEAQPEAKNEAPKPSLAETLASFASVSPVEGRLLEEQIASIKANEEKTVAELEKMKRELEEARRRSVDNEVLKQQLKQFENSIGAETMARYGMSDVDAVMQELTSKNGDVVGNAASRMIAACNSTFMSMDRGQPASKRKRELSAPPPPVVAEPPVQTATADLLRRALAAKY